MLISDGKTVKNSKARHIEYYDMQTVFDELYTQSKNSKNFATKQETINKIKGKFNLDANQIKKINRLREKIGNGTLANPKSV